MFDKSDDEKKISSICLDLTDELYRYGTIINVHTEKSLAAFFIKFSTAQSAENASDRLNNRFYNGRKVTATTFPVQNYNFC